MASIPNGLSELASMMDYVRDGDQLADVTVLLNWWGVSGISLPTTTSFKRGFLAPELMDDWRMLTCGKPQQTGNLTGEITNFFPVITDLSSP